MPLRVHCPNGCLIRMPNNRAGRIVRCPKCKSPIRLPSVPDSEFASGNPVICQARIATPRTSEPVENATGVALNHSSDEHESIEPNQPDRSQQDSTSTGSTRRLPVPEVLKPVGRKKPAAELKPKNADQESEPLTTAESDSAQTPSTVESNAGSNVESVKTELAATAGPAASPTNQPETTVGPIIDQNSDAESPEDWIDGEGIPIVIREMPKSGQKPKPGRIPKPGPRLKSPRKRNLEAPGASESATIPKQSTLDRVDLPKPATKTASLKERSSVAGRSTESEVANPTSPLLIDLQAVSGRADEPLSAKDWQERLEKANSDRKMLARFFAVCLCVVAVVNMVPAFYQWYHWTQLTDSLPLPRWIYILIFVGAVHLIYAIFLAQVPDWSAMRAVALAMLAVAFVFGFVSTGLLVGGGQGNLSGFLGIPFALSRQACMWCVAMLCLATLMSYWGGKESSNWQRAEQLLSEILSTPTGQA